MNLRPRQKDPFFFPDQNQSHMIWQRLTLEIEVNQETGSETTKPNDANDGDDGGDECLSLNTPHKPLTLLSVLPTGPQALQQSGGIGHLPRTDEGNKNQWR